MSAIACQLLSLTEGCLFPFERCIGMLLSWDECVKQLSVTVFWASRDISSLTKLNCVKLARDSVLHIAQHIFLISSFTTCVQLVMIDQFLGNPNESMNHHSETLDSLLVSCMMERKLASFVEASFCSVTQVAPGFNFRICSFTSATECQSLIDTRLFCFSHLNFPLLVAVMGSKMREV